MDDSHRSVERDWTASRRTLATSNAVYEPDLDHRILRQIFTSNDERILAVRDLQEIEAGWTHTLVITEHSLILLDPKGTLVWRRPFEPIRNFEDQLKFSMLEPAGRYAVWVSEKVRTNAPAHADPPILVTWFGNGQGEPQTVELPPLVQPDEWPHLNQKLLAASLPPVFIAGMPLLQGRPWLFAIDRELLRISLFAAVACLPVMVWLGQRYRFSLGAKAAWSGFILLTGIPGLLAFLSVQEWPARESCPHCRKLRLVDRERCEHCGAEFSPPEKLGTEIFESVKSAQF